MAEIGTDHGIECILDGVGGVMDWQNERNRGRHATVPSKPHAPTRSVEAPEIEAFRRLPPVVGCVAVSGTRRSSRG
jgi:hypothetical protein